MKRIQRTRKKGDKLPPKTLVVTRGTKYGNPFKAKNEADRDRVVIAFAEWIRQPEQEKLRRLFLYDCRVKEIEHIACWCSPEQACHADVWLQLWLDNPST